MNGIPSAITFYSISRPARIANELSQSPLHATLATVCVGLQREV
jgi:hypothetical protein